MNYRIMGILFLSTYVSLNALQAQATREYTLDEIIKLAQQKSHSSKLATTEREISRYRYLSFKTEFKPQLSIYGNAPMYNKEFYGVRQPDGAISYRQINQNNSNLGFEFSQKVPFTGGKLSLNTGLVRFDDFAMKTKQYSGTPVFLQLTQPLFAINSFKWDAKIEPLKYEESIKKYFFDMENIAQRVVDLYFNILDAQNNIFSASGNLRTAETNYEIEKKRIQLGTTTEDKLLQLELQMLRNKQYLEQARYDFAIAQLHLNTFINTEIEDGIQLQIPDGIPKLNVDLANAVNAAKKYRPEFIAFQRKMLEAKRELVLTKSQQQEVNLVASLGLNNIGNTITDIYQHPNNQQRISIGFNIPIIDWGRRNASYKTALANQRLVETGNAFDEANIYQSIYTLVKNIELLESNIALARETDTVARKHYELANSLYQLGKLSINDLYLAQAEKDNVRRSLIAALRAYWGSYYLLRGLTLYDFERNVPIFMAQE